MQAPELTPKAARLLANLQKDWIKHNPPALPKNVNEGIGGVSMTNKAAEELEQRGLIKVRQNEISAKWEYNPKESFPWVDPNEEAWDVVEKPLESSRYDWRTIQGLAGETGWSPEKVQGILRLYQDRIVRSSIPSKQGEALFTTRRHYRRRASVWDRLRSGVDLKVR